MQDMMANTTEYNSPYYRRRRKMNVPDNFVINLKSKVLSKLKNEIWIDLLKHMIKNKID
jgi:hypothetical protein